MSYKQTVMGALGCFDSAVYDMVAMSRSTVLVLVVGAVLVGVAGQATTSPQQSTTPFQLDVDEEGGASYAPLSGDFAQCAHYS